MPVYNRSWSWKWRKELESYKFPMSAVKVKISISHTETHAAGHLHEQQITQTVDCRTCIEERKWDSMQVYCNGPNYPTTGPSRRANVLGPQSNREDLTGKTRVSLDVKMIASVKRESSFTEVLVWQWTSWFYECTVVQNITHIRTMYHLKQWPLSFKGHTKEN